MYSLSLSHSLTVSFSIIRENGNTKKLFSPKRRNTSIGYVKMGLLIRIYSKYMYCFYPFDIYHAFMLYSNYQYVISNGLSVRIIIVLKLLVYYFKSIFNSNMFHTVRKAFSEVLQLDVTKVNGVFKSLVYIRAFFSI